MDLDALLTANQEKKAECTGEEFHAHYVIASGSILGHTHTHSNCPEDFNRLHHHPPLDHEGLTADELHNGEVVMKVPF